MIKDDKSTLTPYEARFGVVAVFRGDVELQRHKILHYSRGRLEASTFIGSGILSLTDSPLIHIAVLNYIHRLYFKPYRTDIEYDQLLAKILRLGYATPPDDSSAARLGFVLHRAICARVDRALLDADIPGRKHYSIRPLFRASYVVIRQSDYQSCGVISDISQLPVVLALTGNTDGLHSDIDAELDLLKEVSEPVSLETSQAVRTTLGVVAQLMVVEQFQAEKMGWGKGQLRGPSSKWVDTHRYPIWTGEGARTDVLRACQNVERSEHAKVCQCSEPLSSLLTQDL
ncbi:hypothetical protein FPANT_4435 [Fusarium pseudoanthophilum]|uniref:Uncharacterized protein n=1 Tax=Fusarium pseudoanthophilum TaxID=48495 RepID=A0A8H5PGJ7_9HYPO|nr:hypothetical protein FPANT_4435 [Fusarium pseudoanthophilum]